MKNEIAAFREMNYFWDIRLNTPILEPTPIPVNQIIYFTIFIFDIASIQNMYP